MLGITVGVALVGLAHPGEALHHRRALRYALANAVVIATYTFIDGKGVRLTVAQGASALSYVLLLFVLDGIPYPTMVVLNAMPPAGARSSDTQEALAAGDRRWQRPRSARTLSRCGR